MAKLVPLTQGRYTVVSDWHYERVMFYNWHAFFNGLKWYAAGKIEGKNTYLHRFLTNAPRDMDVDHINGDSLCNADYNLRVITRSGNLLNKLYGNKNKTLVPYNYEPDEVAHDKTFIFLLGGGRTLVDPELWDYLYPTRWHLHHSKWNYSRVVRGSGSKMIFLHREVMQLALGRSIESDEMVDHVSGDTSDNRLGNLRLVTNQENTFNAKVNRSNNTTGFKGVTYFAARGKFVAQVCHNYKHITIGYFLTAEEAARAYDQKVIELFGQFARTNFPISDY